MPIRAWTRGAGAALAAAAAAGLLLGGCRTLPAGDTAANVGDVSAALVVPPPGAARLALDTNQRFVYPNLSGPVAMPDYPPDLLPLRLPPVEVCVEVDIDEAGAVFAARPREDATCPGARSEHVAVFSAAALEAVGEWRYDPAYVCQAPDGFQGEDPCLAEEVVEHPTRLRLSYAFRFSQHDGRPVVERTGGG